MSFQQRQVVDLTLDDDLQPLLHTNLPTSVNTYHQPMQVRQVQQFPPGRVAAPHVLTSIGQPMVVALPPVPHNSGQVRNPYTYIGPPAVLTTTVSQSTVVTEQPPALYQSGHVPQSHKRDRRDVDTGDDAYTGYEAEFECPISYELMTDPVVAADGHTYQRHAITTHIQYSLRK